MSGILIGQVTHFFGRIGVAAIMLTETIQVGDNVHFLGRSTDFRQEVVSLQIERQAVDSAGPGEEVAVRVMQRVRPRDKVYRLLVEE